MYAAVKALALVSAAFSLVSASPPMAMMTLPPAPGQYPAVHKISCDQGSGTGFEAGGYLLSVAHVTTLDNCTVEGQPIVGATNEIGLDFSVAGNVRGGFRIDCAGFKAGEYYFAVGNAEGGPERVIVLQGTGQYYPNGEARLLGYPTVIPGMSGGPILNLRGAVVGTVNAYKPFSNISYSRSLRDTSLCRS